jgi:hypothetical protein
LLLFGCFVVIVFYFYTFSIPALTCLRCQATVA